MKTQVLVIGGGAAGLICAGFAAQRGLDTLILERNERPARKVMITGKGRCNVTNASDLQELIAAVPKNGRFLYSAFSAFSSDDTIELLRSMGVETKTERGKRVFPVSDRAVDVVDALVRFAKTNGAAFYQGRAVKLNIHEQKLISVTCENGDEIFCDAAVICTGGLSYPKTGSTGDGYDLAKQAGHSIIPPVPSLVPLCIHEGAATRMQGLSLRNTALKVRDNDTGKTIYSDFGELLFTHFGVSGPIILSASAHMHDMRPGKYSVVLDLKPALTDEMLDKRLLRDFQENAGKDFINAIHKLLPGKMLPVLVDISGIPAHSKVGQITKEQRSSFCRLLKNLTFIVDGFRPIEEAIVTAGGVAVNEIQPGTMRSQKCENLYFAGEVMDVDAYTGGYNLQIAFSTGCIAGKNVLK